MTDTVATLPALLRAARDRFALDCPTTPDLAIARLTVIGALEWAELVAGIMADRMPDAAVVEVPRVPRFGEADAAGPDRGLAGGRPHP